MSVTLATSVIWSLVPSRVRSTIVSGFAVLVSTDSRNSAIRPDVSAALPAASALASLPPMTSIWISDSSRIFLCFAATFASPEKPP